VAKTVASKKLSQEEKENCRMITPEFRASYPHVFKAQAPKPTDKKKFSITMLYPKESSLMGSSLDGKPRGLKEVIKNAKIAKFGPNKKDWPELESPVVDGDDPKYADKEGYKGCWVIKATTNEEQAPGVVGPDAIPLTDPSSIYPGCYCRAYVYAYVWEYMGKQGVGFILDHVQKLRDGKSFGGKKPVEQVFAPVDTSEAESEDDDDNDFR
jgi:Protein of unknown function (DUF2815)